jgi:hypothetical protein
MECKMTVNTPPSQAAGAAKKFQLIGRFKPKNLEVAEDGSSFTFLIEAPMKKMMGIQRRCQTFQHAAKSILRQKVTGLAIRKEQRPQLEKFIEQTDIVMDVVTPATAEELDDIDKTLWARIKDKFR